MALFIYLLVADLILVMDRGKIVERGTGGITRTKWVICSVA